MSSVRPRVLIVEDEAGVRDALERGLARSGFDTTAVAAAADALRSEDHDIALIDLGLPDRDGVELCRELRGWHPERPIIVVTGRRDELDVVDALDAGADDYVTKPFSLAVLTARIRRHLDRSSAVTAIGALRIDRLARRVTLAGEPLDLTAREFDLLVALAVRTGDAIAVPLGEVAGLESEGIRRLGRCHRRPRRRNSHASPRKTMAMIAIATIPNVCEPFTP